MTWLAPKPSPLSLKVSPVRTMLRSALTLAWASVDRFSMRPKAITLLASKKKRPEHVMRIGMAFSENHDFFGCCGHDGCACLERILLDLTDNIGRVGAEDKPSVLASDALLWGKMIRSGSCSSGISVSRSTSASDQGTARIWFV